MSWASEYIDSLQKGETIKFRPRGSSMKGLVEDGQEVTVEPVSKAPVEGDIVLCKVAGKQYLHKVVAERAGSFQIGNNKGFINGWIPLKQIFGICIAVEGKAVKTGFTELVTSEQPMFCQVCGHPFTTAFKEYDKGRVCGDFCWQEYDWRRTLSSLCIAYRPRDQDRKRTAG